MLKLGTETEGTFCHQKKGQKWTTSVAFYVGWFFSFNHSNLVDLKLNCRNTEGSTLNLKEFVRKINVTNYLILLIVDDE